MLEEILPPQVRSAEAFGESTPEPLFPEELALVAGAGQRRRDEFAAARACARRALGGLGLPPGPVLRDASRAPLWPRGVVGSLTHCAGYRAAAVAWSTGTAGDGTADPAGIATSAGVATIGIDAEPHEALPDGVLGLVASAGERDGLDRLRRDDPSVCWDRLLFCAKEAVYKAWFPLARRWLGFADAVVGIHPDGRFSARLGLAPGAGLPARFDGRWLARDGLLLAAIAVSNRPDRETVLHRGPA